jgi:hypothetical protein
MTKPFVASTAVELFEQVIFEILTKQIIWDNVTLGVAGSNPCQKIICFDREISDTGSQRTREQLSSE